jgi:hypothetical protein
LSSVAFKVRLSHPLTTARTKTAPTLGEHVAVWPGRGEVHKRMTLYNLMWIKTKKEDRKGYNSWQGHTLRSLHVLMFMLCSGERRMLIIVGVLVPAPGTNIYY